LKQVNKDPFCRYSQNRVFKIRYFSDDSILSLGSAIMETIESLVYQSSYNFKEK